MKSRLTIGSRGSRLALWQAEWVRERLNRAHPPLEVQIEIIKTSGDMQKDAPLSVIGGRGIFTKELEEALLDERIDLAVHSLKDLPTTLPEGLTIAAVTEREDARDALVVRQEVSENWSSLELLPANAVVGTSSPRRLSQLKHLRPDVIIKDLRGNVDTRLRKLDAGEYDAIILASAGLRRLGFERRISAHLSPQKMLPAVGQGALGIETRKGDEKTIRLISSLDHGPTRFACTAERELLRRLGGGCQVPIAAYAVVDEDQLHLDGLVAGISGDVIIRETLKGRIADAARIGAQLAERLRRQGSDALLTGLK